MPVANGDSAGSNKVYQDVETKTESGSTTYVYQYRYKMTTTSTTTTQPTIVEPAVSADRIFNLTGNVGSQYAGKSAAVWVYKYTQASDYSTEYVGETTVGADGTINILNAKLLDAPTIESGDYTIAASVTGQERAIVIGTIDAPKPVYTVTFYDYDRTTILSSQRVEEGSNAELPSRSLLHIPEGSRFTTWSESVNNVKNDMNVFPESETERYVVTFVNWETQEVSMKEFFYGSELIADGAPKGKTGYVTEWVVSENGDCQTITDYTAAGKTVTSNMIVVTRSTPEEYSVTILAINEKKLPKEEAIIEDSSDLEIASEQTVENNGLIDFSEVQPTIEENPDYIFLGWINTATGEAIRTTRVTENLTLYPLYTFVETTEKPEADIATGEYTAAKTVTLSCATEDAVIWYTTDGSDPKTSDTAVEYVNSITISSSCHLRFYASAFGRNDSEENMTVYAINTPGKTKYHVVTIHNDVFNGDSEETAVGLVKDGRLLPTSLFDQYYGYVFAGLYYDEAYQEEYFYTSETVVESMDLYANYALDTFSVEFKDYDGRILSTQSVSFLEPAESPNDPSREGYVFVGWDSEFDCITEDTSITAKYIPQEEYATVRITRTRPLSLNQGSSVKLTAVVDTASSLHYEQVWYTDHSGIVAVDDNGTVTGMHAGTATVYVELPYTGSVASLNVTVTESPDYSIILNADSVMGFDSERNLRGVPIGQNTVGELKAQFENEELEFRSKTGEQLSDSDYVGTGAEIKLVDGDEVLETVVVVLTGDMNGDGYVNNRDVAMISRYLVAKEAADACQMIAIDVNGDGRVNNRDAAMLSRYLVGKEVLN